MGNAFYIGTGIDSSNTRLGDFWEYAPVTSVSEGYSTSDFQISVNPNPAHDMLTLNIVAEKEIDFTLQMVDVKGKIVLTQNRKANTGLNSITINTSQFSKGMYMLGVKSDFDTWKKILIE